MNVARNCMTVCFFAESLLGTRMESNCFFFPILIHHLRNRNDFDFAFFHIQFIGCIFDENRYQHSTVYLVSAIHISIWEIIFFSYVVYVNDEMSFRQNRLEKCQNFATSKRPKKKYHFIWYFFFRCTQRIL